MLFPSQGLTKECTSCFNFNSTASPSTIQSYFQESSFHDGSYAALHATSISLASIESEVLGYATCGFEYNSWAYSGTPIADADETAIRPISLERAQNRDLRDGGVFWEGLELVAGIGGIGISEAEIADRLLRFDGDDNNSTPVYLESCDPCFALLNPVDVTFNVDMSTYPNSFGAVYLNGSFNGWCGSCEEMSDNDGDGVYTTTLTLSPGTYEYKFTLDGWGGWEDFATGTSCTSTIDGWTNRSIIVTEDTVLTEVCWNSCQTCENCMDIGACNYVDITFNVDMSTYNNSFGAVNLNGSFNGWCGSCEEMSDNDGDGVYTTTVTLSPGTYEYIFSLDGWGDWEDFTAGTSCTSTIDGSTHRSIIVTEDTVLTEVCWNSCQACENCKDIDACNYGVNAPCEFNSCTCEDLTTMSFGGFAYPVEEIAGRCWFKSNLKSFVFADGTLIPFAANSQEWSDASNSSEPIVCAPQDDETLITDYGLLYGIYAVADPRGLCPSGWYVSSDNDWKALESFLGMDPANLNQFSGNRTFGSVGQKLKAAPDNTPAWNGLNLLDFGIVPSGMRSPTGETTNGNNLGQFASYWTSTVSSNGAFIYRDFKTNSVGVPRGADAGNWGVNIRCVKGISGCTNPDDVSFNPAAHYDDGSCLDYPGCTNLSACNYNPGATVDDGSCIYAGECDCDFTDNDGDGLFDCIDPCTDLNACNYNHGDPNEQGCDFSCNCQDEAACNFGQMQESGQLFVLLELSDGNFEVETPGLWGYEITVGSQGGTYEGTSPDMQLIETTEGACWQIYAENIPFGFEGNLVITLMNENEDLFNDTLNLVFGELNGIAFCVDDYISPCAYPELGYGCDGNCLQDVDGDGVCDLNEISGCQDVEACNFDPLATDEDGSCQFALQGLDCEGNCLSGDNDGDGICNEYEPPSCGIAGACNYDPYFVENDASMCTFPGEWEDCEGGCLLDTDGDGVCDPLEVPGCMDTDACNYNSEATDENGTCTYPGVEYDCDGNCLVDADGDGVCDAFEIPGCTDDSACNFSGEATDEDGSCQFALQGLDCQGNCLSGDNDGDGICNEYEPPSCGIAGACNYDPYFVDNDASMCSFPGEWEDCEGGCLLDVDGDGVCDNVNDYVCGAGRLLEEYEGSFEYDFCTENPPPVDFRVVGKAGIYGVNQSTNTSFLEWSQSEFTEEVTSIVAGDKNGGQNLLMGIDRSGHPIPLLFCPETGGFYDPNGWAEFITTPTDETFTEVINVGQAFVGINASEELVGWGFTEPEFATNYPPVVQNARTLFYRPYWYSAVAILESNETASWGGSFQMPFLTIPNYIAQSGLQIEQIAMTEQNGLAVMEDGTMRAWGTYNAGFVVIPAGLDSIVRLDFSEGESWAALLQNSGEVQTIGSELMRIQEGILQNIIDVQASYDSTSGRPKIVALRADGRIISIVLEQSDSGWTIYGSSEVIIPGFEPILCIPGCTDSEANNYNDQATEDDGSCQFGCDDSDGDGVCDSDEILGCTIASACNFNPIATQENGTCYFADEFEDCNGNCMWESVATGACGEFAGLTCEGNMFAISPAMGSCSSIMTGYFVNQGEVETAFWQPENDVTAIQEAVAVFVEPNDGQLAWINADGLTGGLGSCNELVVPQISNALKVDMEGNHGVILRNNGTVASFAPSSAYDALEQTPIIFNYFVLDACSGEDFNLAVDGSQNILYWGIPNFKLQNDYTEVPHAGGFVQVTAYGHAAAAITEYGELVVWGDEPGLVDNAPTSISDAVSVVLGEGFGVVLHENGDVTQWGTNAAMPSPPAGLGNIIEITASRDQVLVQTADGTFASWGINNIPSPTPYTPLNSISVDVEFCIPGCTNPDYHNYDPSATIDDGSCNNIGCTVSEALNFEPWATDDDGSCIILGCTDVNACNYNPDAQYGIRLETIAVHNGMVGNTDLTGFTTYQVILDGPNALDRLSAVMGDANTPMSWQVIDGLIWNEPVAGDVVPNFNSNFIEFIPQLAFDSWVTIGVDPYTYNASEPVILVESPNQPWVANFNSGEGIVMDDVYGGAWFVAGAQTTGVFGDDHAVLLAQITTNGQLHVESMNIQILPAALSSDDVLLFYQEELHACSYPDGVLSCDGTCVTDSDEDGVCDENEIAGCTNPSACNFNEEATDDDGTCEVYEDEIELYVETIAVHDEEGALNGYITYRLHALMNNADERISAVIGFDEHPLLVEQGNGLIYQHPIGGVTPSSLSTALLEMHADAAYDSYVALGRGHEDLPTSVQILSGEENWDVYFESGLPIDIASFVGGGWYSVDANDGLPIGEENRVLLGQFTTLGGIQGQLSIQYFDCKGDEVVVHDLIFTSDSNLAGCMDSLACNYNPDATIDDGMCCFSSCATISGFATVELEDLIGSNPVTVTEATVSAGSMIFEFCVSPSCYLVTGTNPSAITATWNGLDVSDDVIEFSVLGDPESPCVGCTDNGACNYQATTIYDNGSCEFLPGDFNGDLATSVQDMLMLLSEFDDCELPSLCATDMNGSGFVSVEDLLLFLSYFGISCVE